jgi:ABC-type multidrug transport system fused ATPase/permease subunit
MVNVIYYMSIHVAIVLFIIGTYMWVFAMSTFASVRVGRIIHKCLTDSLMAATFRWLDVTPTSRIIARCTQDIQSIDGPLVQISSQFIATFVMGVSRLITIAISTPIFVVPGFVIGAIGVMFGQIYIKAQLSIKRERSNAKAPVVAAFNGAFSGLVSIRAYGAEEMFTAETMKKVDTYTQVSIVFWNLNRWVAVRIQALSAVFAGGLAFYLVYGPSGNDRSASKVGFTLNMAGELLFAGSVMCSS